MHLLLRLGLDGARLAVHGLREVVPDQLGRMQRHAVGEVVRVHRDIGFHRGGQGVEPGVGRQTARLRAGEHPLDDLDRRLEREIVDDAEGDAVGTRAQLVDDLVDDAELFHDLVTHDHGAFDAVHVTQVLDGVRLEVGLCRDLEPLHVVVPPSDALDVEQVDRLDVARHRVAAARSRRVRCRTCHAGT